MSVTSVEAVQAIVSEARRLANDPVQDVIDREEAFLAHELRAPLAGVRTQRVWVQRAGGACSGINLMRPTDAIDELRDNDVVIDDDRIRLLATGTLVELDGPWTGPLVEIDYTPNDEAQIVRVVIELCRLTLTETAYNAEDLGGYKYQRAGIKPATSMQIQVASRRALVRSLQTGSRYGSVQLDRVDYGDRITAVTA